MDWLIERQPAIERRLAKRHLKSGGLVLFDLTSSYFEGVTCPLAKIGYSRDGKRGTLQVNYGLLTDARGCPVSVEVFEGNTGDPKTLLPQVEKVRRSFGLDRMVLAGDRGMISNIQIEALAKLDGIDWITALKSGAIARLAEGGHLQLDLFDERNLITLTPAKVFARCLRSESAAAAVSIIPMRARLTGNMRCESGHKVLEAGGFAKLIVGAGCHCVARGGDDSCSRVETFTAKILFDTRPEELVPVTAQHIEDLKRVTGPWCPRKVYAPQPILVDRAEVSNDRYRAYALVCLQNRTSMVSSTSGGRNIAVFHAASFLGKFVWKGALSEGEVRDALMDACPQQRRDRGRREAVP